MIGPETRVVYKYRIAIRVATRAKIYRPRQLCGRAEY